MLTFDSFHQEQTDELENLFEEIGDREGHYLYFIAYRSPENKSQWCLYIGIKYKDTAKAEAFFGSLRYNPNLGKNEIKNKKIWESGLISFNASSGQATFASENTSKIYMSSAAENASSKETVCHAYAKGIYDGDLAYHPLICTQEVIRHIADLKKLTKDDVYDKIDKLGKQIKSELKGDIREYKIPKVSSNYYQTEDYGYRIYVCENMNNYQDFLNEFLFAEDLDRNENRLRSPFIGGVRDQGSENDEEFNEKEINSITEQVRNFFDRYYTIILKFYKQNSKYKIRKEFEDRDDFEDFLIDVYSKKENQSLRIGKAEYDNIRAVRKRGEKVQGQGTMINLPRKYENLSMIFASLPEGEREDLIKFLGAEKSDNSKQNEKFQKPSAFDNVADEKKFRDGFSGDDDESRYIMNNTATFSQHGTTKRLHHGIAVGENSIYKLLYNSPDPEKNLIVRAWKEQQASPTHIPIEKSEAKQKLKYYFENFELPLIYKEVKSLRIERMTIGIQKDGQTHYLTNNMKLKPATQLTQEYEAKGIASGNNIKQLEGLFTLWDLFELLGCYNLNGLHKGCNLSPSPVQAKKRTPTFFSKNPGLIQPWWKDRTRNEEGVTISSSYEPQDGELLEEGVLDTVDQVLHKVGSLYKLTTEQLKQKKGKLLKILNSSEKYDRHAILLPLEIATGKQKYSKYILNVDGKEQIVTHEKLIKTLQGLAAAGIKKEKPKLYKRIQGKIGMLTKRIIGSKAATTKKATKPNSNTKIRPFKSFRKK